jgi:1,2-diacylglycerol 3-alpha-glucosyltransferase
MVKPFSHGYARALANIADVVIGPSEKVSAYFKKCKVKKEVVIVPNAMEINLFDRANVDADKIRAIRDGLDFAPTDFVLGFCGRLGSEKNIDTLLKFISKTIRPDDGVKFMIIGGGPLAEELPLLAHKLALSNIVKFAGRIEHPDVPPYFAACDAYITASLSEIHSISTLEAQAMGLPVVQIREKIDIGQVVDGENGYFFGNAQEMRDKIILLKSLPKIRYEELRQNVRQSIMHLSPSALAERVETIYEGAIGNYKRSGSITDKHSLCFPMRFIVTARCGHRALHDTL